MITARIEKVRCSGIEMYEVTVKDGKRVLKIKPFTTSIEKSKMIDWATRAGAEEVTYKL